MATAIRQPERKNVLAPPLVDLHKYFSGAKLPATFSTRVTSHELEQVRDWLSNQGYQRKAPTLIFMPRMEDWRLEALQGRVPLDQRTGFIKKSAEERLNVVRMAVEWASRKSYATNWNDFVSYPYMHCCAIRRPTDHLLRLLDSTLCHEHTGHIASVFPNYLLQAPENKAILHGNNERKQRRERAEQIVGFLDGDPDTYLSSLGIGNFTEDWGGIPEYGRSVRACVLDSGADESHVALQGQSLVHALYDPQGQFKHAMDTTDHGAHGTAVSGIIAAHTLSREELGLPGTSTIRLGVCPAAKLAVVTVAQGECFRETLSLTQLTGGLDWAIENKNHPKWGQYEVVNVSLELVSQLFSSVVQEAVDRTVRQFLPHRLIPIFASGNGGPKAEPLSTLGCCVGSSDRTGRPAPTNGRRVDLCAPGEDLLCVQPPIPQLDNDLISCHSGSSFAAAFVTGTILLLSRRTGRSAWDCLEALLATSGPGKIINPGQAQKEL